MTSCNMRTKPVHLFSVSHSGYYLHRQGTLLCVLLLIPLAGHPAQPDVGPEVLPQEEQDRTQTPGRMSSGGGGRLYLGSASGCSSYGLQHSMCAEHGTPCAFPQQRSSTACGTRHRSSALYGGVGRPTLIPLLCTSHGMCEPMRVYTMPGGGSVAYLLSTSIRASSSPYSPASAASMAHCMA